MNKLAVGDKVTHEFQPQWGTGKVIRMLPHDALVQWPGDQMGDTGWSYKQDLTKVEEVNNLAKGDKVTHKGNPDWGVGTVALARGSKAPVLDAIVRWENKMGDRWHAQQDLTKVEEPISGQNYNNTYPSKNLKHLPKEQDPIHMTTTPTEQIKGSDPRLKDFWAEAKAEATARGFCKEYEALAIALGAPPAKVKRTYYFTVPVEIEVEVEEYATSEPKGRPAHSVLNGLDRSEIKNKIKVATDNDNFFLSSAKYN